MKRGAWLAAVGIGGLLLLLVAVTVQKLWSADFWWQLKNGMYILEHHSVPGTERWSHTSFGTPVREMRWLYCVAIAWLWESAGVEMIVLLKAVLIALAFGVVAWPVRRVVGQPLVLLSLGLALVAGMNRWVVRPELVTDLLTAVFLVILERATRDRRTWLIWLLPALQVVWVNSHSTYVFGPMLAAMFWGADWVQALVGRRAGGADVTAGSARPNLPLLAVVVLTVGACWVNPYGHWGAMYAAEMFRQTQAGHATARIIGEMQSPFDLGLANWGWDHWCGAALCVLGLVTTAPLWRRVPLSRVGVLVISIYLFATLQRNLGLIAVMLAWVNTRNGVDLVQAGVVGSERVKRAAPIATAALGLLFAFAGWYIASDRYAVARGLSREFGLSIVEYYQPRGAEAFILKHRPQRELWNDIRDGSYLVWRVSDVMPIFIDGRTDAYSAEFMTELDSTGPANWDEVSAKWKVNTAVIPTRNPLALHLHGSPNWALVHVDPTSYVFLRDTPENASIIAATRIDPKAWKPAGEEPDDRPPAWKAAYGGVGRAWYNGGMAYALAQLGGHAAAMGYYEKAVANAPTVRRYRVSLAPYYIVSGKSSEAERLLEGVTEEELGSVDLTTAKLLAEAGQVQAAVEPAERALGVYREDQALRIFVADLHFQTGNYRKARERYDAALRAGHGTYNELNKLGAACEQTGDLREAARAYRASLEWEPRQPAIWNMAGGVAGGMGDFAGAKVCFERALALKPDFEQAKRNLERAEQLLASPAPPSQSPSTVRPPP